MRTGVGMVNEYQSIFHISELRILKREGYTDTVLYDVCLANNSYVSADDF
jgi:ketosteroid isomerase-like protein